MINDYIDAKRMKSDQDGESDKGIDAEIGCNDSHGMQ